MNRNIKPPSYADFLNKQEFEIFKNVSDGAIQITKNVSDAQIWQECLRRNPHRIRYEHFAEAKQDFINSMKMTLELEGLIGKTKYQDVRRAFYQALEN